MDEECFSGVCVRPCTDKTIDCGYNAHCFTVDQTDICLCMQGYVGDPYTRCNSHMVCGYNGDCSPELACIDRSCSNPCTVANPCPKHSICKVENHRPICVCGLHFVGTPAFGCVTATCMWHNDCVQGQLCINGQCQNGCRNCGEGALCEITHEEIKCTCPPGTKGDPFSKCKCKNFH